jgi:potassium efflux system protein
LEGRLAELQAERARLADEPAKEPDPDVTEDDLVPVKLQMEKLKQEEESAAAALEGIGERREQAGAQLTALPERIAEIEGELGGEVAEGDLPRFERRTRELELVIARLSLADARVFVGAVELLSQVREKEAELAREKLARLEAFTEAAREAIDERNRREKETREAEARRLAEAAERERDPIERFKKRIDARIEAMRAEASTDESWLARIRALKAAEASRKARLEVLKRRLESRFREGRGVSGRAAELLRTARRRVEEARERLQSTLWPELEEEFELYLTERARTQDQLWEIEEPLDEDPEGYRELLALLPEDRHEEGKEAFLAKRADLKSALDAREKGGFGDIYGELSAIEKLYGEKQALLDDLYKDILRRIYWIQSDAPLGSGMLAEVPGEAKRVAAALAGPEARAALAAGMSERTGRILVALAGIAVLVVVGLLLFFRLKSYEVGRRTRGGRFLGGIQRILAALFISALAPLCLVAASLLLGLLSLPEVHERLGTSLLQGLAAILLVRRFARALFRPNGIVVEELNGTPEVARQLFVFFRWATAGLVVLWLPWWLLGSRVFSLVHLPRLLYTAMLVYFALLLLGLVKPRGAVVSRMSGEKGLWYRAWRVAFPLVAVGMAAIVVMDMLGYRTGAALLTENVLQTFAAAFLLFALYHLITALFREALPRLGSRWWAEESRESTAELSHEVLHRITRFAGLVAVVIGLVLLAGFWGFDQQVKGLAESVRITTVDAEKGISLTLWDVFLSLAWIVGAHLVVRNLGAFYEATLFSRLEASDPGSRYVIVTISKYLILLVGYSAAVLGLHISFSSLGWILAAASVGLGFGLQEIVSNFVSGLILFVERPIKVGDFVTVGTTLGTVEKINIRATQVMSRDRKVIIIPNRLFISEQVINWSHNDDIVRSTINVGVAYGTDVKKARDILLDIVRKHPLVKRIPPPQALLLTFGASSLDIQLRIFTDIVDRRRVEDDVNTQITKRFAEEGIEIPFPQQDLHIRSGKAEDLVDAIREAEAEPEGKE